MKFTNKKGFTVVELVIVIAIVAVLSAVLIPTFSGLVQKANVSADVQLVRNLNTALATDKSTNGKHSTMHDAAHALEDYGYNIALIRPTAEGFYILWDSVNDVFCYAENGNGEGITYVPDDIVTAEEKNAAKQSPRNYFTVDTRVADFPHKYSVYYNGTAEQITLSERGFDAGHSQINVIVGGEGDFIIRTYGGKLTVNNGNVTVYGFVNTLSKQDGNVTAAANTKFHDQKADVIGIDTDNGALYGQHLYGSDNKCMLCTIYNPEHIHDPGEPIKTDIEGGYNLTIKCTLCDYVIISTDVRNNVIEIPGEPITIPVPEPVVENCKHENYSAFQPLTKPTCTTPGVNYSYCTACGNTKFDTTAALDHDYKGQAAQEPTCDANGHSAYEKCERCNATKGYETVNQLGHDMETIAAVPATCTDAGTTEYQHCKRCNNDYGKSPVNALGHDWETTKTDAATCTTAGTRYQKCKNCTATQNVAIAVTGHDHGSDGFCTNGSCHHYNFTLKTGESFVEISEYDANITATNNEEDSKRYFYRLTKDVSLTVSEFVHMFGLEQTGSIYTVDELYFDLNGHKLSIKTDDSYSESTIYGHLFVSNMLVFANGDVAIQDFQVSQTGEKDALLCYNIDGCMPVNDQAQDAAICFYNTKVSTFGDYVVDGRMVDDTTNYKVHTTHSDLIGNDTEWLHKGN